MTESLAAGFVDGYRYLYPDRLDNYTWWSFMPGVRARNIGWRIDYFLLSERLTPAIREVEILDQVPGSDHCPVLLELA